MAKESTYTKEELMEMKVSEIKLTKLYSKIDSTIKKKEDIADAMIEFQKGADKMEAADVNGDGVIDSSDVSAVAEAMQEEENGEKSPKEEEPNEDESESEKNKTEEEGSEEDEEKVIKSEKPVFHRGRKRKKNIMTFR